MGNADSSTARLDQCVKHVEAVASSTPLPPGHTQWTRLFGGPFSEPLYLESPHVLKRAFAPVCEAACA